MQVDRPISIAITFFIIILLVFFFVNPQYKTFTRLQTELGEKQAEYNAEFDYYNAIENTYFDLQSHQDDINKIDDALPRGSNFGRTIYYLQQAAQESGMIVKSLALSQSAGSSTQGGSGSVKDLVFSANLLGDYSSLQSFISSLEQSSRLFEITNISFGAGGGSASQNTNQFQTAGTSSFTLQIKTQTY